MAVCTNEYEKENEGKEKEKEKNTAILATNHGVLLMTMGDYLQHTYITKY